MLNITNYRNASQNYSKIPPHIIRVPSLKSLQITNTGGDVEKKEPPMLLVGMLIGAVTMENSMEVP